MAEGASGALGWAGLGLDALGALGSALGGSSQAKEDRKLQQRLANQQAGLQKENTAITREGQRRDQQMTEGAEANRLARQRQTNPMRDQVLYALMARTGMSPGAFQPRDIFNPGTSAIVPQHGGIDLNALASKMQQYTPGAGGVDLSGQMENQLMANLGYAYGPDGKLTYQPIYDRPDIANSASVPERTTNANQLARGVGAEWDARYGDSYARQHGGQTYQDLRGPTGQGTGSSQSNFFGSALRRMYGAQ